MNYYRFWAYKSTTFSDARLAVFRQLHEEFGMKVSCLSASVLLFLCASVPAVSAAGRVGVAMPAQSLQRWNQDGANMKAQLTAAGYEVDLQFAGDNEVPVQVAQIENMVSSGCEVLVISAVDGNALTPVLNDAKTRGVKVIAYDRLIMNSDAVAYYATFDAFKVGAIQGRFIHDRLKLDSTPGPYNVEFFTGDPGDNNVNFFFGGAMSVLKPYIADGKLVVKSGQIEQAQAATPNWSTEKAQARMENIITAMGYSPNGTKLDAVYASNDSLANGITNALVGAGYSAANFPILTGQDCDTTAVKNILSGTQSMSIFKDTRMLAAMVVKMVDAAMKGTQPEINDMKRYDNGMGIIPSYLYDPIICTVDNYKALLIDSGYYTEEQLAQ
jgi:putative multiple sugar transport system substrate-binding protein